jgi:hypothetical protein
MKKRIIILLIALLTLLISCTKPQTDEMAVIDQSSVFMATELELPENYNHGYNNPNDHSGYPIPVIFVENKAYFLGWNKLDDENLSREYVFLIYDFDSRTSTIEKINTYNEDAYVDHIAYDSQMNQITIESVDGVKTLNKISVSGDKVFSFEIAADKQKVITDKNDNIYVAFPESLESYDPNGNHLRSIEFGNYVYNDFNVLSNGKIFVEFVDRGYLYSYRYVNDDGKSLSSQITKNEDKRMYAGDGFDMYYRDNTSLYGYNESDNKLVTLINWMDSGIAGSSISYVYVHSPDKIAFRYNDTIARTSSIYVAEKTDEIVTTESKDIVIASLKNVDKLDALVLNFNNTHSDYNVTLKSYLNTNDYSEGAIKLNNDILAGNIPDIIIPDYYMPLMSYINKGIFVDMYEFIDNDPDLSRDSFYDIIYSTYEMDGKLYHLLAETRVSALVTKEKNVNGKSTWTYDEFKEFYDSVPDDVIFCDEFARSSLLYNLADTGLTEFVNYKDGTCDFDNELFINIINVIKSFDEKTYISANFSTDKELDEFYLQRPEMMKNDEIFVSNVGISGIVYFIRAMHSFGFEDIAFMGYPSPYGDANSSTLYGTEFMVTQQSNVKEGAWEFIKYYVSDEVRLSKDGYALPTTKSGLRAIFDLWKQFNLYIEKTGIMYAEDFEYSDEDMEKRGLTYFELTEEHFAMMEKLMNSKNKLYSYDDALMNIVVEELSYFFADNKTAEETARVIQNRASVYLSEIK